MATFSSELLLPGFKDINPEREQVVTGEIAEVSALARSSILALLAFFPPFNPTAFQLPFPIFENRRNGGKQA